MKKAVLMVVVGAAALYQAQAFANRCDSTHGSDNLPFYQVWDIGGDSVGNGGEITCVYQDSQGNSGYYVATKKGRPDTDHGVNWGEIGGGEPSFYYCAPDPDTCLFYDETSDKTQQ